MNEKQLNGIWNYYLSLENDLANTAQYIEPSGQENVYSFEFAKLLILACTEVESVFKLICKELTGKECGDIGDYKRIVLHHFPKIVDSTVTVKRLGKDLKPFENWGDNKLLWWEAYQKVKHGRNSYFGKATYMNATLAISALYILIFYIAEKTNTNFSNYSSKYIVSDYQSPYIVAMPNKKLPDFQ